MILKEISILMQKELMRRFMLGSMGIARMGLSNGRRILIQLLALAIRAVVVGWVQSGCQSDLSIQLRIVGKLSLLSVFSNRERLSMKLWIILIFQTLFYF